MDLDDQQQRVLMTMLGMQRQSWEQGVASHALLDLELFDLAEIVARDAVTRQNPEGMLAEIDGYGLVNSGSVGEVVRWAGFAHSFTRQVNWLLRDCPRAADGTLFHIRDLQEMWIDTVYMVVPLLLASGEVEAARLQFEGHRRRLFDASTGLYAWRWDENEARVTHPEHWGTGTGWVVAGISRSIRILGDHPFSVDLAEHARGVIDACLALRRPDGIFHNIVDDKSTFAEGNLAQMLAYAILTGVLDGWLPASYEGPGRSLVASARNLVDRQGFVQRVCGAPHFDHQGTSVEAQAFFLLATNAEQRLDASRAGR